jgi:hypothetical protein
MIWDVHHGSDYFPIPDAGSGSKHKNTGSRIGNTDLQMDSWSRSTYQQTDGIRPSGILNTVPKAATRHDFWRNVSIFIHLTRGVHRRKSNNDRGGEPEQKFSYGFVDTGFS